MVGQFGGPMLNVGRLHYMRRIFVFLASILICSSGFAGTPQMLGDTASGLQVLRVFEQWTSAYEKGDLDGSMSIFAPNVVFTFQGSKDQDYEALRKGYVQDFATRAPGTVWVPRIEEVYVEGTVAIVRSVWELKVKSGSADRGEGSQPQRRYSQQRFR